MKDSILDVDDVILISDDTSAVEKEIIIRPVNVRPDVRSLTITQLIQISAVFGMKNILAVISFLDRNYRFKSIVRQIPHDVRWTSIHTQFENSPTVQIMSCTLIWSQNRIKYRSSVTYVYGYWFKKINKAKCMVETWQTVTLGIVIPNNILVLTK